MSERIEIDLDAIERAGGNASRAVTLELVRRMREAGQDAARYQSAVKEIMRLRAELDRAAMGEPK